MATATSDNMVVTDHGNGLYEATETSGVYVGKSVFYLQGRGISDYVRRGSISYQATLGQYTAWATKTPGDIVEVKQPGFTESTAVDEEDEDFWGDAPEEELVSVTE